MKRRSDTGRSMKMSDEDLPNLKGIMMNNPINIGIRNGSILTGYDATNNVFYDPVITIPKRATISSNDIADRILRDVLIDLVYNSSLHYVKITASVQLDRTASASTNTQTSTTGA